MPSFRRFRLICHAPRHIRVREIRPTDLDPLASLLHRGFPERPRQYFVHALGRLTAHATPQGFPKYGYVLEADGSLVGAILVIFSTIQEGGTARVRGNPNSWYVEPEFRAYAALLRSPLLAIQGVTLLNITPGRHTWPILALNGYKPLCSGVFAAVPMLSTRRRHSRLEPYTASMRPDSDLTAFELQVLRDHAGYGCFAVTCAEEGRRHPFVFSMRRWTRWKGLPMPYVVLAYCRSVHDFAYFAEPLGRYLARKGVALVFVDSNGRIPHLRGRYLEWGPKLYRGPNPPRLGDLAYTEWVMFDS